MVPAIYRDFVTGYKNTTDFAFVYIEEAHATDEWPISSSRYMPDNEVVSVKQPRLVSERVSLAQRFVQTFGLGSELKVLVDDPQGNAFQAAYAPWPIRIYVIENGRMEYISSPENSTHNIEELKDWLLQRHQK